jgi:hypothetical protein
VRVSFCDKPSPPIVAGIRHFTIAMPLPQRINDLNPDTWILAIDSQQAFQHVKRSSRFIPETGKVLALTLQQVLSLFFSQREKLHRPRVFNPSGKQNQRSHSAQSKPWVTMGRRAAGQICAAGRIAISI